MKGVIYKYTSPSGKVYIGQTCRERGRRNDFRENISYGGSRIDNARAKYGADNFEYEVLFSVESNDLEEIQTVLNEKEQYYIDLYKSNKDEYGYNMNDGGAGNVAFVMSKESRAKIGTSTKKWIKEKGHPLKGKGHRKESIEKMRINTKKKYGKDNPNYGWKPSKELMDRLAEMSKERKGELNPFFGKTHTDEVKKFLAEKNSRKVRQYHPTTFEFIKEYKSATEASIALYGNKKMSSDIGKVCNKHITKNGIQRVSALGFRWKWADDESQDFLMARVPPPPSFKGRKLSDAQKELISKRNSKAVKQICPKTNEVIAIFQSVTKAAIELGKPKSSGDIGKMCNGKLKPNKKLVLGYKWEWL